MKLLLTSAGFTNSKIADALLELAGLPADKIKLAFVPTAANLIDDDKEWLIDNLIDFKKQGYKSVDIVDIAAIPKESWVKRFEDSNVICFGGGNENYLAQVIQESGVGAELPRLLKSRTYVGISAGSMVAGTFPSQEIMELIYPEEIFDREFETTLGLVNLHFLPHLNSEYFQHVRKNNIESIKNLGAPTYALDDQSALKVVDGKVEIITEGQYLEFN